MNAVDIAKLVRRLYGEPDAVQKLSDLLSHDRGDFTLSDFEWAVQGLKERRAGHRWPPIQRGLDQEESPRWHYTDPRRANPSFGRSKLFPED